MPKIIQQNSEISHVNNIKNLHFEMKFDEQNKNHQKQQKNWTNYQKEAINLQLKIQQNGTQMNKQYVNNINLVAKQTNLYLKSSKMKNHKSQKVKDNLSSNEAEIEMQTFLCLICMHKLNTKLKIKSQNCQHYFCYICLINYVNSKINLGGELNCPHDECNSHFEFTIENQLKLQQQQINEFEKNNIASQSLVCLKQNNMIKANNCYRECRKCKIIIQKTSGCNHIKCICKYQFCYLCGEEWTHFQHMCNQSNQRQKHQNYNIRFTCFQCFHGCGGSGIYGMLIRFLLKLLISLPLFILLLILVLLETILVSGLMLIITMLVGLTAETFYFIFNQPIVYALFLILLLPFTMLFGIAITCKQFYIPAMFDFMKYTFVFLKNSVFDFFVF